MGKTDSDTKILNKWCLDVWKKCWRLDVWKQWGPKVLELDALSLRAWGFLQDSHSRGVSSCASSPGKLAWYQAQLPLLKGLGTRQHQPPLKTTGKTYQVWAWIKVRRNSEQSQRTLKSSWVRKSEFLRQNERVLEVGVEWMAKSERGSLDEYGNECLGKERWPVRLMFEVVNPGRSETDSVLTESASAPKERCPPTMGHQTASVHLLICCRGAVANSMGKLRGWLCADNRKRPAWSPQGRWQGLTNNSPLQGVPWPVRNRLWSKSHYSFELTGSRGAGCWYRVPEASRVLRVSCSSLNSPGCILRVFFLYFISQV